MTIETEINPNSYLKECMKKLAKEAGVIPTEDGAFFYSEITPKRWLGDTYATVVAQLSTADNFAVQIKVGHTNQTLVQVYGEKYLETFVKITEKAIKQVNKKLNTTLSAKVILEDKSPYKTCLEGYQK